MTVGVLAIQGAFIEHINVLKSLNIRSKEVRTVTELEETDALIIPGGESTTFNLIMGEDLRLAIHKFAQEGKPIWGVCAGLIFLSQQGLLDCEIERNFFGSHLNSFIKEMPFPSEVKEVGEFPAVFIRAPVIKSVKDNNVKVLLTLDNDTGAYTNNDIIIAVRSKNILGTAFHPELIGSDWHEYFISTLSCLD